MSEQRSVSERRERCKCGQAMSEITLETLRDKGACVDGLAEFQRRFGERVTVNEELAVSVAEAFDWDWAARALLSPQALAEYKRVRDQAWAEYKRVCDQAQAEYWRVRDQAWAEYKRVCDQAQAEYWRVCDQAQAEYFRVRDQAWAEYKRVCDQAWAEYFRVRARAFARLMCAEGRSDE